MRGRVRTERRTGLGLRLRLLGAFLLPAALFLVLGGLVAYRLARHALEQELGRSLSTVAAAAASGVRGELLLTIQPGDDVEGRRVWRTLSTRLEELRRAAGMRRVVALDAEGRVRADAGGALPVGAPMPELGRDRREFARVLAGELVASEVLFVGSDGRTYTTGYAPVHEGERVVGAVAVEGGTAFFAPLGRLAQAFALVAALAVAVLALVAVLVARGLARPLSNLLRAALRIGRGDLATPVPAQKGREIGALARELERMRAGLQARDRQLQMMLAGVAHEVRNPLGGIALYSGLVAEDLAAGAGSEAREHVGRIQAEVAHLSRIVEDFLAFAREQPLHHTPLEARAWVDGACELMAGEAQARGVRVVQDVRPAELEGDESLLTSALVNLVRNALQAAPDGSEVRVVGAPGADGAYAVEVSDAGPGVPEALRERIFEPFFTTREKGTGLGLALARKVVRAHGGELTLVPGSGRTTFRLEVPVRTEARR